MLSKDDNEKLVRVGPGTPCGELLRRYWHPVCIASELTPDKPKKRMSILGEPLVLFLMPSGEYGLVSEHCLHRHASLYYGFVDECGIRCAYHGWLFDQKGQCIERPFEPLDPLTRLHKRLPAYSVEKFGGLIFAYMGPQDKKPLLPHWDILVRKDGRRYFEVQEDLSCNWLQVQENAVDVTHTYYLHSYMFRKQGKVDDSGFGHELRRYGFQPFQWGILKSWSYGDDKNMEGWGNLMVFPNMLRLMTEMHWRVPVDDETTRIFWVGFEPSLDGKSIGENYIPQIIQQPPRTNESGEYLLDTFMSQDAMAVETQGKIVARHLETLGSSDRGIIMFRRMLEEQIGMVQTGANPMALVFRPEENVNIDLREWMGGYLPMSCLDDPTALQRKLAEDIFDERHEVVNVPPNTNMKGI